MEEMEIDREALLQTFRAEAEEIFGRMEQALVALEARPGDEELLHGLFRDAHTLKGSAGLVSFDLVRDVAHDLESVLERLRDQGFEIDRFLERCFHKLLMKRWKCSKPTQGLAAIPLNRL